MLLGFLPRSREALFAGSFESPRPKRAEGGFPKEAGFPASAPHAPGTPRSEAHGARDKASRKVSLLHRASAGSRGHPHPNPGRSRDLLPSQGASSLGEARGKSARLPSMPPLRKSRDGTALPRGRSPLRGARDPKYSLRARKTTSLDRSRKEGIARGVRGERKVGRGTERSLQDRCLSRGPRVRALLFRRPPQGSRA